MQDAARASRSRRARRCAFVLTHVRRRTSARRSALDADAAPRARPRRSGASGPGAARVAGEWAEPVRRSLITLKALTYAPTGGIVAAPTTSLPEQIGGVRNWDYRYCWLRDATLTLLALMNAGYYDEARGWRDWLVRAVAGSPEQMQIMYGIAGERRLPELRAPLAAGLRGLGAGAHRQRRRSAAPARRLRRGDGRALPGAARAGLPRHDAAWGLQRALLEHLEKVWTRARRRASGRCAAAPRHFTYSKVMAWVAFDRAVKMVEAVRPARAGRALARAARAHPRRRLPARLQREARLLRAELRLERARREPAADPDHRLPAGRRPARASATVEAIQRELTVDGLVLRYRTHEIDRRPAAGRGRVPRLQLLARRQPVHAGPPRRGARAVRAPARPAQRRRPARRGVRPARRAASSATSRRRSRTSRWSTPR